MVKKPITLTYPTQSANSLVFGTVADNKIMLTCSGSMMMTSSQTTPRCKVSCCERAGYTELSSHLGIVYIVNLVENDKFDITNQISAFVEHASKNFCRHDQTVRFWIDLNVAGKYAHRR